MKGLKLRRALTSLPASLLFALFALVLSAVGIILNHAVGRSLLLWLAVAILLALAFLAIQAWAEYRRRSFDPTLMLHYQEKWDKLTEERRAAAETLLNRADDLSKIQQFKTDLDSIDEVLDVLDDIGFYVNGDQISPEVAHQHLHHWIRGYWSAAKGYIDAWRVEEPLRWQHIETLFEEVERVEQALRGRAKGRLTSEESKTFLQEEASSSVF